MNRIIIKRISYITILSLFNSILNFLFQMLIANRFGAGIETDAYFLAFSIPEWIINITTFILPVTIIPAFSTQIALKNEDKAWHIAGSFITLLLLALSIIVFAMIVFSGPIVNLLAGNFNIDYKQKIQIQLIILLPTIIISSISWILTGIYYSRDFYLIPVLSPLLQTVVMIVGIAVFGRRYGIVSAAISTIIGSLTQLFFLLAFLPKKKFRLIFSKHDKEIGQIFRLMIPLIVGNIIFKSEVILNRYLASFLAVGSISYLYYANKISRLLTRLTSKGVTTTFFPRMSRAYALNDDTMFCDSIETSFKIIINILIVVSVIIVFLGLDIIKLLFVSGDFDLVAAENTYITLLLLVGVIFAGPIGDIMNNVFFSMKNTKTLIGVNLILFIPSILLKILLMKKMSFQGIALSTSIVSVMTMFILLIIIKSRLENLKIKALVISFLKAILSGVFCYFSVFIIQSILKISFEDRLLQMIYIGISSLLIVIIFFLTGIIFRNELVISLLSKMGIVKS